MPKTTVFDQDNQPGMAKKMGWSNILLPLSISSLTLVRIVTQVKIVWRRRWHSYSCHLCAWPVARLRVFRMPFVIEVSILINLNDQTFGWRFGIIRSQFFHLVSPSVSLYFLFSCQIKWGCRQNSDGFEVKTLFLRKIYETCTKAPVSKNGRNW